MSRDLPASGARVWLRMPSGGEERQTTVSAITAGGLVVRCPGPLEGQDLPEGTPSEDTLPEDTLPEETPPEETPPEGQEIFVVWVHRDQPLQVPTRFVTVLDDPPGAWHLETTGAAETTQRRRFVRAGMTMQVELLSDDGRPPAKGFLSDLSEGGARAVVPSDWIRTPTQDFTMVLPDVDGRVTVRAYIRWLARDDQGRCKIGMHFLDVPGAVADQIRSYVFARQLSERRRLSGL
ncbi:MAG: hypothetical protein QG608_1077 [Actinomycetota bacterium]|nr:hypothetical protein [Actinomycetota bacterium]